MAEKMDGKTMNITEENLNKLKDLFPEVFEEGKINFDKLQVVLGENIDKSNEKYEFSWNGKFEAMKLAQLQSTGTLIPCKEKSKDWDTTQNLYIEGDNLEVLKLLQKSYVNQIKMIYIDPPYNTGNDFVYKDNFADNIANYKEITGQATKSNAETAGRYHTNWLNMMYPRLKLARNLLTNDGIIFISIDDNEQNNLKRICDEIFGENNFVANVMVKANPRGRQSSSYFAQVHDYLLIYRKTEDLELVGFDISEEDKNKRFNKVDEQGTYYEEWELRKRGADSRREDSPNLYFPIYYNQTTNEISTSRQVGFNIEIIPKLSDGTDGRWRWSKEKVEKDKAKLYIRKNTKGIFNIYEKKLIDEKSKQLAPTIWDYSDVNTELGTKLVKSLFGNTKSYFDFPKPIGLIDRLMKLLDDKNYTVLDFFSGSGTTANAVMELNSQDNGKRKFICVQLPEKCDESSDAYKDGYSTICDIAEKRISISGDKIKEKSENVDTGFKVFKLDTSNLVKWNNTPTEDVEELKKRLQQNLFYIVDGRSNMDLVYEIMLKYGLPLTLPINEKKYGDYKAYEIASDTYKVMICLDRNLPIEIIEQMTDEAVGTYVFADHCFGDANVLINTEEILKKKSKNLRIF